MIRHLSNLWLFLRRFVQKIREDRIPGLAAEMAYFLLFSFFPMLIVVFVLLSYVDINLQSLSDFLEKLLPEDVISLIMGIAEEVTSNHNLSLLSIGVLTALWASVNGAKSLILGVNIPYGSPKSEGFLRPYLIALLAIIGIPFLVALTLFFQVAGESIVSFLSTYVPSARHVVILFRQAGTVLPVMTSGIYFLLFYRLAPNLPVRFSDILVGTVFTTVGWFLSSFLFSVYIRTFANYSRFYGSIGSVIMLLFWLYLTSMIILLGAEMNAMCANARKITLRQNTFSSIN